MPSVSRSQQRYMGMVHACQKSGDCASPEVKKTAKSISFKDADEFASTKHKGLPEKKKPKKKKKKSIKEISQELGHYPTFLEYVKQINEDDFDWGAAADMAHGALDVMQPILDYINLTMYMDIVQGRGVGTTLGNVMGSGAKMIGAIGQGIGSIFGKAKNLFTSLAPQQQQILRDKAIQAQNDPKTKAQMDAVRKKVQSEKHLGNS